MNPLPNRDKEPRDYGIIEAIEEGTREIWVRWLADYSLLWIEEKDIKLVARAKKNA